MIKIILWDIDGTLLNFNIAERTAMRECFSLFQLGECTDAMLAGYSAINAEYWRRLELGEVSKAQVMTGRFRDFFQAEQIPFDDVESFNQNYQIQLGNTICFMDDAFSLIQELQPYVKQYAVTNGALASQKRKLQKSGLDKLLDGAFISDEIGAEKPSQAFFNHVLHTIDHPNRREILIVGDSLSSDMKGGSLAGIQCCWYNPHNKNNESEISVDYTIQNLNQIKTMITDQGQSL